MTRSALSRVLGRCLLAALLAGYAAVAFTQIENLVYITEDYPPYNYLQNGRVQGPSVELLLAITREMGQPIDRQNIAVMPWARGFRELQQGPGRVLFVTTRTAEREHQFQWAGPITHDYVALIASRSKKLRITSAAQLQGLRIGLVRDDVAEEYLQKFNIDPGFVTRGTSSALLARMLVADRIDLWPIDPRGATTILKHIGANPADYQVVANLHAAPLYFAFSADVDPELVAAFQHTLDRLRVAQPALFPVGHFGVEEADIPPLQ